MSLLLFCTLINDSPAFQHKTFSLAFHGRLVFFSHLLVGSRPANRHMCPTVGALSISMWASRPAEITGPIPQIPLAHNPMPVESQSVNVSSAPLMLFSMRL